MKTLPKSAKPTKALIISCATAGCHNYHDNTALYYEFLDKHQDQAPFAENPHVPARGTKNYAPDVAATAHDGPQDSSDAVIADWLASRHAAAGVNCSSCHEETAGQWQDSVSHTTCATCHDQETDGWLAGKHGMRQALGLSPMTPEQARLPMHAGAAHQQLIAQHAMAATHLTRNLPRSTPVCNVTTIATVKIMPIPVMLRHGEMRSPAKLQPVAAFPAPPAICHASSTSGWWPHRSAGRTQPEPLFPAKRRHAANELPALSRHVLCHRCPRRPGCHQQ